MRFEFQAWLTVEAESEDEARQLVGAMEGPPDPRFGLQVSDEPPAELEDEREQVGDA